MVEVKDATPEELAIREVNVGAYCFEASVLGMSREGLYKALSADGNPSFATIMKVVKALGLKIEFHAVA